MPQLYLESFARQDQQLERFSAWLFETIRPYIKDRVLEINSGSGDLSSHIIREGFSIQLNASSETNRSFLREKFKTSPLVKGIHCISFLNHRMETRYLEFQERFSTIIAISNIMDQQYYEPNALKKALRFLRVGGHFIVVGRCTVSLYPNSPEDFTDLKTHNYKSIMTLLGNCEPIFVRFFDWGQLSFVAVGRKLS